MTILVDRPRWPAHGTYFAHLASDGSLDELHGFVTSLALARPLRFHRDHYDVPLWAWDHVIDRGAQLVSTRELVRALRAGGLRARGRRERPALQ